jgi:hypothetical protein
MEKVRYLRTFSNLRTTLIRELVRYVTLHIASWFTITLPYVLAEDKT